MLLKRPKQIHSLYFCCVCNTDTLLLVVVFPGITVEETKGWKSFTAHVEFMETQPTTFLASRSKSLITCSIMLTHHMFHSMLHVFLSLVYYTEKYEKSPKNLNWHDNVRREEQIIGIVLTSVVCIVLCVCFQPSLTQGLCNSWPYAL